LDDVASNTREALPARRPRGARRTPRRPAVPRPRSSCGGPAAAARGARRAPPAARPGPRGSARRGSTRARDPPLWQPPLPPPLVPVPVLWPRTRSRREPLMPLLTLTLTLLTMMMSWVSELPPVGCCARRRPAPALPTAAPPPPRRPASGGRAAAQRRCSGPTSAWRRGPLPPAPPRTADRPRPRTCRRPAPATRTRHRAGYMMVLGQVDRVSGNVDGSVRSTLIGSILAASLDDM